MCGGKNDIGTGRSPGTSGFYFSIIPHYFILKYSFYWSILQIESFRKKIGLGRIFRSHFFVYNSNKPKNAFKQYNFLHLLNCYGRK
jgi:hypothetical protein